MIEDRIRSAAAELRREITGPVPTFSARRRPRFALTAAALATAAAVGGLWVSTVHNAAPQLVPLVASTVPVTLASVPEATEPVVSTTVPAVEVASSFERVTFLELRDFVGKYTIDYQPATVVLGSTGTVSYSLLMTESSFCIEHKDLGSGCSYTDDGRPLPSVPQEMSYGSGANSDDVWTTYFIVPSGLTLQVLDSVGPTCEMHRFSLEPYGDADLWACENSMPQPDVMDLAVTKGNRIEVATIQRPRESKDLPKIDPVTTTGYRIGDTPGTIDDTLPWLLVVDRTTGEVVGFVLRLEHETPTFDNIVLVYDETGKRIGQLDDNWQLLTHS